VFIRRFSDAVTYLNTTSVAESHYFYTAPAPGENFDAAPALAPTLLYRNAKFLKRT
jgi:hypothetical protein